MGIMNFQIHKEYGNEYYLKNIDVNDISMIIMDFNIKNQNNIIGSIHDIERTTDLHVVTIVPN